MMSANLEESTADMMCCANCGIAEVDDIKLKKCDDIKLKKCDDCQSVSYCSDKCREEHRENHEEECNKRKTELHDRKLFTQPDGTHLGECPLCFLPLPIDKSKSMIRTCCSEVICKGCVYANIKSNIHDSVKAGRCPFCREPAPNEEENDKRLKKRMKANDPAALRQMGLECYEEGEYDAAFGYLTKAAELGDLEAHSQLGYMYHNGLGVEKDEEKSIYHCEKAAIGGHPFARFGLAIIEARNGNMERAVKHFIISANLGDEDSMKELWKHYSAGNITKEELDATLRSHHAAINATKSEQREIAESALSRG